MFCQCDKPVCRGCDLPVQPPEQKVFNFNEIKEDIFSSQLMETTPRDKIDRAFNFITQTYPDLTKTKTAIRHQSGNELLTAFFEDIGEIYEPFQYLLKFLIKGEEDPLVIQQLKNYSDKIPKEKEDDILTPDIQCSSPTSEEEFHFPPGPPVQYVAGNYPEGIEIQPEEENCTRAQAVTD